MPTVLILNESRAGETRVALVPHQSLAKAGLEVVIESGAGDAAGFPDALYVAAGATVGRPAVWPIRLHSGRLDLARPAAAHR